MTRIVTARVGEVLGLQISSIQQAAQRLNPAAELQEIETAFADLERAVAELKNTLAGLPYKHSV